MVEEFDQVEDFDDVKEAAIIEEKKQVRKKLKKVKDADELNVTEMKFLPDRSPVLLDGRKSRNVNAKTRPRSGKSEITLARNDDDERRIRSRNRRKRRQRDEEQH